MKENRKTFSAFAVSLYSFNGYIPNGQVKNVATNTTAEFVGFDQLLLNVCDIMDRESAVSADLTEQSIKLLLGSDKSSTWNYLNSFESLRNSGLNMCILKISGRENGTFQGELQTKSELFEFNGDLQLLRYLRDYGKKVFFGKK